MSEFGSRYQIEQIPRDKAMQVVVEKHYLHRKCPCEHAWALVDNEQERDDVLFDWPKIVGVVTYGTPSSPPLRGGICGPEYKSDVLELNRLWVHDDVPRNGESYLIGNTLKMVGKPIVVSFADKSQGHTGFVYQATNWIYTGLSAKRTNWLIEGEDPKHCQTLADKYTAKEVREKFGDRFKLVDRPRKHRYIYFACDKRKERELRDALRYEPQDYPKPDKEAP